MIEVSSCCRETYSVDLKADPRVGLINAPALRRSRPARTSERQKHQREDQTAAETFAYCVPV